MYGKCFDIENAEKIWNKINGKLNTELNIYMYAAMMNAYANSNDTHYNLLFNLFN